ncbi:MAG TPA: 4-alpha-glucanotransferase [Blastocatellia bacterium]|nr:4-alpha-glucanotransferase [Blastocatellia bacterium]
MNRSRSSGILLHPTSLPGRFGIGDLGAQALAFADFLQASGQSLWQVLPLTPTGYGDSPYQSFSAFAGNTLLISPDLLVAEGLLSEREIKEEDHFEDSRVDFGKVIPFKRALLARAYESFSRSKTSKTEFLKFCHRQSAWLDDYSLFRALKDAHGGIAWNEWEPSLALRKPDAIASAREKLSKQIDAERFAQYLFFKQWLAFKEACHKRQISIVGDLPIFVAYDSADVWACPEQFKLDRDGTPKVVAGVPPDYFSATGQLWGNPIYDWERERARGFEWWITRIRAVLEMLDFVRIDHFRGFCACWEVPYGETTAEKGRWVEVPGRELFATLQKAIGTLPIIAEDLGVITPDVVALRDEFGFPGMRILQFGFSSDSGNHDLPHNYVPNTVVYTGTHDNDTCVGWFRSSAGAGSTRDEAQVRREREYCLRYLNSNGAEIHWDFIRAALASVANTAIIPLQDLLGFDSRARMNLPASTEGNWTWRVRADELTLEMGRRLRDLSDTYGRIGKR